MRQKGCKLPWTSHELAPCLFGYNTTSTEQGHEKFKACNVHSTTPLVQDNVHIFKKRRRCSRFFVEHLWFCVTYMTRGGAKKINHLCFCIEHLLPLHSWTQQRRCLKSEHLLPYIYEHNRGGVWSLSCTETEAINITTQHQSWTLPPLVWIYVHNRGVWLFWMDKFAFLSTSSGHVCHTKSEVFNKKSQTEVFEIFCWTPLLCSWI